MELKRLQLATLAIATLLLLGGCMGTFGTDDDVDREAILTELDDLESYEFEMVQTIEDGGFGAMETTMSGTVDVANEEMYMSMDMGFGMAMESYVIGDTQYTEFFGTWTKMPMPDTGDWQGDHLAEHELILEDGDLEVVGEETVEDVETTVLEVEADEELILESMDVLDEEMGEFFGEEDDVESFADLYEDLGITYEDVTYRLYVDESTDLLHKVDVEMTMDFGEESMATTTEMWITNHDEPVDIELPDEAADAVAYDALDDEEWLDAFGEEFDDDAFGEEFDDVDDGF